MTAPLLERVVPNETWQLVIEFGQAGHRLFDSRMAREEMGWGQLAYPNRFKNFTYTADHVLWPDIGELSADYLYRYSAPLARENLEHQVLRLSYRNQAPTDIHPTHHVYGVYLFPFSPALFDLGESIGGGHMEMGGSRRMSLDEVLAWPDWKKHFVLSGGEWAIPMVEAHAGEIAILSDLLVRQICCRGGM
jgi:hypothetical protein